MSLPSGAVPLALNQPRAGNNRGFIFALGVLFLFYVLMGLFEAVGKEGVFTFGGLLSEPVSLMIAAWAPIAVMIALGVALIRRKSHVL